MKAEIMKAQIMKAQIMKKRPDLTIEQKTQIIALNKEGISGIQISKKMNIHEDSVYRFLRNPEIRSSLVGKKNRKYTLDETFLDKLDTPEKAYFLGWMYTDGYNNEKNGVILLRLQKRDKDVFLYFQNWFKTNAPITIEQKSLKNPKWQDVAGFKITSKILSSRLAELGCGQAKTFKIVWPEWLEKSLWKYFIKGIFEGDGGLTTSLTIVGTENLCEKIKEIVKDELGVSASIFKTGSKGIVRFALGRQADIKKFLDWIYEGSSFHLERKYQKYLEFNDFILNVSRRLFNEDGSLFSSEQKKDRIRGQKRGYYHKNKILKPSRRLINPDGSPFTDKQKLQRRREIEKRYRDKKKSRETP